MLELTETGKHYRGIPFTLLSVLQAIQGQIDMRVMMGVRTDSLDEVKLCLVVCKDNETKELLHGLKSNRDHCVCQGHSWESSSQCIDSLQARGATSASLRTEKALFHTKSFWVFTGPFPCGKRKPFKSLQPECLESIEFDALDILTSHGTSLMHTKCLPGPCLFFGYLGLGHLYLSPLCKNLFVHAATDH